MAVVVVADAGACAGAGAAPAGALGVRAAPTRVFHSQNAQARHLDWEQNCSWAWRPGWSPACSVHLVRGKGEGRGRGRGRGGGGGGGGGGG